MATMGELIHVVCLMVASGVGAADAARMTMLAFDLGEFPVSLPQHDRFIVGNDGLDNDSRCSDVDLIE